MTLALETKALEKQFGGLHVTRDLSLRIEQGARHALIGPNGAGKTTVINLLTGVLKPNGGRILLEGNDITDLPVHKRVLRGLSRTFQINQLYADLMLVLVLGGTGYLYGGLIGAVVFKMLQEVFSTITPQYWMFWIGLVLVVIVLVGRARMHRWALWVPNLIIRQFGGRKAVVAIPESDAP